MRKKAIFAVFCSVILLLLLAPLSSGQGPSSDVQQLSPGHGWQEDIPSQCAGRKGSTPDVNLTTANNTGNITTVVLIRFGNIDLFFIQQKSQSASGQESITFSNQK